jgi:hypothetical protein
LLGIAAGVLVARVAFRFLGLVALAPPVDLDPSVESGRQQQKLLYGSEQRLYGSGMYHQRVS